MSDSVLTAEEGIKSSSDFLRGNIANELANDKPNLEGSSDHLLKFHGIYAQDNRDVRRERSLAGETLDYIFMIRVALPGGKVTPQQWLALDAIAEDLADGSIRLTTRQAVQYHGVVKQGLRPLAFALDAHLMTSFGACGDVVRNTVMCPDLVTNATDSRIGTLADQIAKTFKSKTMAHWEIFVNGDLAASKQDETEHEFYGETYLPRKFKIGIASPEENCIDIYAQDLGLVPVTHPELGEGFTVVIGGGLGRSYANPDTFARLADPLTFVTYDEVEPLIASVLASYRDLGDRTNRRRARMKYVIADGGLSAFKAEIEKNYGSSLRDPVAVDLGEASDHLGWHQTRNGTWQLGIRVGAGRVRDIAPGHGLRTALRLIADNFSTSFVITAQQDIVISNIAEDDRDEIEALLDLHEVVRVEALGNVERAALACPALPTCGQALAEAERKLPDIVNLVQSELDASGNTKRRLQLRMTGCPNGCARPAVAEVGLVGKTKTSYDLWLGGGLRGDRLAQLYQEKVKLEDVPGVLRPLLDQWREEGLENESFGDFFTRTHTS
jgi:sulfite reductase (ferredoxin)